jgi:hypothetical protein
MKTKIGKTRIKRQYDRYLMVKSLKSGKIYLKKADALLNFAPINKEDKGDPFIVLKELKEVKSE